jgi:hypothetical protein
MEHQITTLTPEEVETTPRARKVREVSNGGSVPSPEPMPVVSVKPPVDFTPNFSKVGDSGIGDYPIKYSPLSGKMIPEVPEVLNYKPLTGFHVTKMNELNLETIDDGLNDILDALCYESKARGFSHWNMNVSEKIRSYLNIRLNSVGPVIENLMGVCTTCGNQQVFVKTLITKFEETGLKDNYKEPFPLKYNMKGEHKFKTRLLRSGDIRKARQLFAQDKGFITKMFPDTKASDESTIVLILEYANTILEHDGTPVSFEQGVTLCRDNVEMMNAVTAFNDYFSYGMNLSHEDHCNNKECPSNTKLETNTGIPVGRSLFRVPIQPTFFTISSSEEKTVESYFDL